MIYSNSDGHRVEISRIVGDTVEFARQGGGFQRAMPKALFDAVFKECKTRPFVKMQVSGEWMPDEQSLEAYGNGNLWNGWVLPHFTLEVAKTLTADWPGLEYDEARDAFTVSDESRDWLDPEEIYEATMIEVDGVQVKVYPVGAGSWCWADVSVEVSQHVERPKG